jgi:S1-C subfamily serine protease
VEWHYVTSQGKPDGPVSQQQLLHMLSRRAISAKTLVWREGMAQWLPMSDAQTGLGVTSPSVFGLSRRLWLGVAAAVICLIIAGLGYAAYRFWWHRGVISDVIDRDRDLSGALGLVVCGVHVTRANGTQAEVATAAGSCFSASPDGHLITNKHVVEDVWTAMHADLLWEKVRKAMLVKVEPRVWVFIQGKKYQAKIVHVSDRYDLAIMTIDRAGPYFSLSAASDFSRGKTVSACGYPDVARTPFPGDEEKLQQMLDASPPKLVEDKFKDRDFEFTMTRGTISRVVTVPKEQRWIQHSATVSPGNSGGPLISEDGTVIGINMLGLEEGKIYASLALPQLREEIDRFIPKAVWK